MGEKISIEKRSKIMSSIKSKGTSIENKLRVAMCQSKIRGYRINPRIKGNPDFAFTRLKIAIFCDGDFWHGKDYKKLKKRLTKKLWLDKIGANIERDKKNNKLLKKEGWSVLRLWESDINNDILECVRQIKIILDKKREFKK